MGSYDFLTERTEDGRQLRIRVLIDEFTMECLAIEVGRSFRARDVIMTVQYLFAVRGGPEHLRSDNGLGIKPAIDRTRPHQPRAGPVGYICRHLVHTIRVRRVPPAQG